MAGCGRRRSVRRRDGHALESEEESSPEGSLCVARSSPRPETVSFLTLYQHFVFDQAFSKAE